MTIAIWAIRKASLGNAFGCPSNSRTGWRLSHSLPSRKGQSRIAPQPRNALWLMAQAMRDALVPVAAAPGGYAGLTFRGELDGFLSVVAPGWRNEVKLIQAGEKDITVSARAIARLADRAPWATLKHYDLDHFEPFSSSHSAGIAEDQVGWLRALPRV